VTKRSARAVTIVLSPYERRDRRSVSIARRFSFAISGRHSHRDDSLRRAPGLSADPRFGCRGVRRHNRTAPFFNPHGVKHLQVFVRDNNVDQALRMLKRKLQREGLFREMKRRRFYEKPSERCTRERSESVRRHRKLLRKKAIHDGLIAAPKKLDRLKDARAPAPSHARLDRPR